MAEANAWPTGRIQGVIIDTGSASNLVALTAAREAMHKRVREEGLAGRTNLPRLRLYCSEHTHSSVEKAAIVLGVGQEGVRKISSDAEFRMKPDALAVAIEEDKKKGWLPLLLSQQWEQLPAPVSIRYQQLPISARGKNLASR